MSRSRTYRMTAVAAGIALLHGSLLAQTAQPHWTITEIPTLGGFSSTAYAINNLGQVTGGAALADNLIHAYRYSAGVMQDLQPFPSVQGYGFAINASGTVAGTAFANDGSNMSRGFVSWADGRLLNLGTLGGRDSWANGLNDAGVVVGQATDSLGNRSPVIYDSQGVPTRLPNAPLEGRAMAINNHNVITGSWLNGSGWAEAFVQSASAGWGYGLGALGSGYESGGFAINDIGQVVGYAMRSDGARHAFLDSGMGMMDLGTLGGSQSFASAINQAGVVVGSARIDADAGEHAFLYANGQMTDLNGFVGVAASGWQLTSANGINDVGQIVGNGASAAGFARGFVMTLDTTVWTGDGGTWDGTAGWSHGIAPSVNTAAVLDPSRSLTITGPRGDTTARALTVGGNGGIATLKLDGGTIRVLGQAGLFTLINAKGVLTGEGTITGEVRNLGRVDASNLTLTDGLLNQGMVTGHGRLETSLSNTATGTVQLGSGQSLLLTGAAHRNSGLVQLTDGAELRVAGSSSNGATGEIYVRSASLRFNDAMTNEAGGRLQLDGALLRFDGGLDNSGQVQINHGGAEVFGAIVTRAGGKIIASGGSESTFYDALDVLSGGELRVSSGSRAVFFGSVQQRTGAQFTGTGIKQYEGGLSIGDSPGIGIDSGDVEFGGGNRYLAEIGGTTRGVAYDAYNVAGSLSFGGTLTLVSWGGFVGQAGQRYDLFDWGSTTGQFDLVDASGLMLAAHTQLDLSRLYEDGTIGVLALAVPEPATWAQLLLGFASFGAVARRARRVRTDLRPL